ncbi:MAG TPA: VWA domain-containing protein [Candidatus Dormibacteraeota bacterium]|nr:VWA domain-containing protein [Candidatus Dormibacteraeota bacterium]
MGFEVTRPLFLGAGALALLVIVAIWRFFPPPLSRGRARLSLGLRTLVVVLLTASLAGFQVQTRPASQSVLVAADLSASVQSSLDTEAATVRRILQARRGDDRAGVLSFGRDPQVEVNVGKDPQFGEFQSQPNPNYTDLAAALQLGGSILPEDSRRHIVVISDGRANLGDAVAEARLLRAEGVRVDTVALPVTIGAEAYVDHLDAPRTLTQGQQANASALIVSNTETPATVRWYLDRALINTVSVGLPVGETTLTQTVKPNEPGFHAVRIVIDPVRDTYAENNLGEALIQVVGPPRVLLVENTPGEARSLENALQSTGIGTTSVTPETLPRSAADLAAYQAVVLVNIPASSLGTDEMSLLQVSVRDLGMGLVVIGGADSYGPGGYAGTPLETALPVQIQIPQEKQKPPVAVMLVLESTESPQGDQVLRGAAESVVEQLTPNDKIGVTNGFGGTVVVPLGPLTDKAAVERKIQSMQLGDPPSYAPDLDVADKALSSTSASLKHVILLGDGDAPDNYQPIITAMHAHGITVSTVAIASMMSDAQLMQDMANWGHGRFYQSNSLSDVPQIFLKETREALKPWIVEGKIAPQLASFANVIPGVPLDSFPTLGGYIATTPRAAADVVLKSPQGDPLLATWQYGLGRVMAWTSDAQGRWTGGLLQWSSANRFFGDIVHASLPQPGDPALQVETRVQGDHTHLLVTAPATSGATVTVNAVTPDLAGASLVLSSTGAGRFEGDLPTDQVGSYLLHVSESAGGVVRHATTVGLVVPFSPEYRDLGTDTATLKAIAQAGGGQLLTDVSKVFALPVPSVKATQPISEILLIIAILLFPLDVALRRLVFRLEDAPAWRAALQPKPAAARTRPVPAEATVTRLRERVEGIRAARAAQPRTPKKPTPPEDPTGELLSRRRRR